MTEVGLVYLGPVYTQNGEHCRRRVVVSTNTWEDVPEPPEIMTSYGEVIE